MCFVFFRRIFQWLKIETFLVSEFILDFFSAAGQI